jgi:1,4-alpha-glucan branching enzyme
VVSPNGVVCIPRDRGTARLVWSRTDGYPGHPYYREFYRDLGFDLPAEQLGPLGAGAMTGLKYHRITARGGARKEPYDPEAAQRQADDHAADFVAQLEARARAGESAVVAAYDAELFGHWWFEGPCFLEEFIRETATPEFQSDEGFRLSTPSTYLARNDWLERIVPAASTWGHKGHLETWISDRNRWIYPHLHAAAQRLVTLARHAVKGSPSPLQSRCLDQMARELLLAQSSDWAFLISTGTAGSYARKRIRDHLHRFRTLFDQIVASKIDAAYLDACEERDRLYPGIDWRLFAPPPASRP